MANEWICKSVSGENLQNCIKEFQNHVRNFSKTNYERVEYSVWTQLLKQCREFISKHSNDFINIEFNEALKKIGFIINGHYFSFIKSPKDYDMYTHLKNFYFNGMHGQYNGTDIWISTSANEIMAIDHNYNYVNKERKDETMNGVNFNFGTCENDNVRMSMYGVAIKNNAGEWVSYNAASGDIINVDIFNFDGGKYLFKMPTAIKDIAVGDVIIHNKNAVFVTSIENGIEVTDIKAGEKKTIIPTKNMFGLDFVTKVVSLFGTLEAAPTPDKPFGNMLPFLMMNEGDFDPAMAFLMMNNNTGTADMSLGNPMMLYFLMKDNKNINDMMPFILMNSMTK